MNPISNLIMLFPADVWIASTNCIAFQQFGTAEREKKAKSENI
jgi:hypothetical protein